MAAAAQAAASRRQPHYHTDDWWTPSECQHRQHGEFRLWTPFYAPIRHLRFDACYSFLHTSYTLTATPKHKLFFGADWQPGRFTLHSGQQWIDGLHTAENNPSTENFWLWDLTASLRISRALKVFVHGENLLAQRYEVNVGFPMPRATVMAGVEVRL